MLVTSSGSDTATSYSMLTSSGTLTYKDNSSGTCLIVSTSSSMFSFWEI